MKKNPGIKKALVFICFMLFAHSFTSAQSNAISISVNGIEYDDPSFALLKETLQKNKNVSSVKTGYDQGTAKISMNYNRTAQNLWDEIPQTTKQFFKISTINDNNIVLESKSAVKQNTVPQSNTAKTRMDDDCRNCYFNLCNYDGTRSFQGKIFKEINKDDGTYYYNCDNGVVVQKIVYKNGYGQTTSITNDTILMSNAPIGTTWGVVNDDVELFGFKNKDYHKSTLVKKNVTVTVNGKTYNDVVVVHFSRKGYNSLIGGDDNASINLYYARGVGLIKQEDLYTSSDPGAKDTEVIKPVGPVVKTVPVKGRYDPSLVGIWKYEQGTTVLYWKFNADGSYDLYTGSVSPANRSKGKCYWGFDSGVFTTNCEGGYANRYDFEKKNDAATGKPAIFVNGYMYVSADNKAAWK